MSALICQHPCNSAGFSYGTLTCKLDEVGTHDSTMLLAVCERQPELDHVRAAQEMLIGYATNDTFSWS